MSTSGNLQVTGTSNFDSTLIVNDAVKTEDIEVSGNAKIAGDINVNGSLLFSNGKGISLTPGTSSSPEIFNYGKSPGSQAPPVNQCLNPNPPFQAHQFGGVFQVYDNGVSGYTGGNIMTLQSWNNGSSIDVAGGGGLLVNYFCGKDIYLGTGTGTGPNNGGTAGSNVYTGDKFYARKNAQIGSSWQAIDPNVSLNILDISNEGLKLWANNNTAKIISSNNNQFTVLGDGRTSIRTQNTTNAFEVIDASNNKTNFTVKANGELAIGGPSIIGSGVMLNVTTIDKPGLVVKSDHTAPGPFNINTRIWVNRDDTKALEVWNSQSGSKPTPFVILGNGKTCVGCNDPGTFMLAVEGKLGAREIKVTMQNPWPDFVFEKEYQLAPLDIVKSYIETNRHLPGIPSAQEIEKEAFGLDIAKMQGLQMQKIEDIYLYLIEMKKEINTLKQENEELKKQISK